MKLRKSKGPSTCNGVVIMEVKVLDGPVGMISGGGS